jgi:hypothetical protein
LVSNQTPNATNSTLFFEFFQKYLSRLKLLKNKNKNEMKIGIGVVESGITKFFAFDPALRLESYESTKVSAGLQWTEVFVSEQSEPAIVLLEKYIFDVIQTYCEDNYIKLETRLNTDHAYLFIGFVENENVTYYILLFAGGVDIKKREDLNKYVVLLKLDANKKDFERISRMWETTRKRLSRLGEKQKINWKRSEVTIKKSNKLIFSLTSSIVFILNKNVVHWDQVNGYPNLKRNVVHRSDKSSLTVEITSKTKSLLTDGDDVINSKKVGVKSIGGTTHANVKTHSLLNRSKVQHKSNAKVLSDYQVSKTENIFVQPLSFKDILAGITKIQDDLKTSTLSENDKKFMIHAISTKFFEDVGWHNTGPEALQLCPDNVDLEIDLDQVV